MKTKYWLLVDDGSQNFTLHEGHIRLDGVWSVKRDEIVELKLEELMALIGRRQQIEKGKLKTAMKKIHKVILAELANKVLNDYNRMIKEVNEHENKNESSK